MYLICIPNLLVTINFAHLSLLVLNFHTTPNFTCPLSIRDEGTAADGLMHRIVDDTKGRGTVRASLSHVSSLLYGLSCISTYSRRMRPGLKGACVISNGLCSALLYLELVVLSGWRLWLSAKCMSFQMKHILHPEYAEQQAAGPEGDFLIVERLHHFFLHLTKY